MQSDSGAITVNGNQNVGANDLTLISDTVVLNNINLTSANETIRIFTDNLTGGTGTIDAGTGSIAFAPSTASNTILVCQGGNCVGGFDSSYDIGNLGNVIANSFTIGRTSHTGDINVNALTPAFDVSLLNSGAGAITMNGAFNGKCA